MHGPSHPLVKTAFPLVPTAMCLLDPLAESPDMWKQPSLEHLANARHGLRPIPSVSGNELAHSLQAGIKPA